MKLLPVGSGNCELLVALSNPQKHFCSCKKDQKLQTKDLLVKDCNCSMWCWTLPLMRASEAVFLSSQCKDFSGILIWELHCKLFWEATSKSVTFMVSELSFLEILFSARSMSPILQKKKKKIPNEDKWNRRFLLLYQAAMVQMKSAFMDTSSHVDCSVFFRFASVKPAWTLAEQRNKSMVKCQDSNCKTQNLNFLSWYLFDGIKKNRII